MNFSNSEKNVNYTKQFELVKINENDIMIDQLIDDLDYLNLQYNYYAKKLDKLYDKYEILVKKNIIAPNFIIKKIIVEIKEKILICEKKFIETIGVFSKNKMNFELIMDKYYK